MLLLLSAYHPLPAHPVNFPMPALETQRRLNVNQKLLALLLFVLAQNSEA